MNFRIPGWIIILVGAFGFAGHTVAQSSFTISLSQVGSDVVATGSGTVDLTGLTDEIAFEEESYIAPGASDIVLGPTTVGSAELYTGVIAGPPVFGPGDSTLASTGSGDFVGIFGGDDTLVLPSNYTSGASLSATATWVGATFSSLGVTPGKYTWSWNGGANTFTLDVVSSVPEPSQYGLGIFLAAGAFIAWRRFSARALLVA